MVHYEATIIGADCTHVAFNSVGYYHVSCAVSYGESLGVVNYLILRDNVVVSLNANSNVPVCYIVTSDVVAVSVDCYASFAACDVAIRDDIAVVGAEDAHFPIQNFEVADCYVAACEVYSRRVGQPPAPWRAKPAPSRIMLLH